MSSCIDAKYCFLNAHCGPGARKGHHVSLPTALERSRSDPSLDQGQMRGMSLPGHGIAAGFSPLLGNRLGLAAYANLSGRYVHRLDVPPPCRAPRQHPPGRAALSESTFLAPERMRPETLPPAGGLVARIRGKGIIADNTNYLSTVDTLIFGRDVDGSNGCRSMADTGTYIGRAGLNAKFEREPSWGVEPPVCHRTFGANAAENTWEAVTYERHDPRAEGEQCQKS